MSDAQRIYLDHAAATPLEHAVYEAMRPFLTNHFGNPSAIYAEGLDARRSLDEARDTVANTLGCHSDELVFTSSGTESDALAVCGAVSAYERRAGDRARVPHIVTTSIEHPAVLENVRALERSGRVRATYVPVDREGIVSPQQVLESVTDETILVSVMYVNSEIGTVQPIRDIAQAIQRVRRERGSAYPYMHTDACQALNYFDVDVQRLGVDLLTANGSKIYGPKGSGFLFVKRGVAIAPIYHGGGQEQGLRPGTENVPAIIGLARAVEISEGLRESECERLLPLQRYFMERLETEIEGIRVNGSRQRRAPNNVHISIVGVESDMIVIGLDALGVACSAKSACKSSDSEASSVLRALGGDRRREGTVRFTMGRGTTRDDIDRAVEALKEVVARQRRLA